MSLSEQRAAAVVEYLVNLGLNANQFTPAGYGPNKPLTENITLAGRAENRRIEFKLKN
jgi:outer membrane protein OmpA-like peptidoglycan-associated protein